MNVLDIFSGIGGFSLGLERAGMRTVAFCEIDPYCQAILRKHWPDVPIWGDVRTLTAETLADAASKRCSGGTDTERERLSDQQGGDDQLRGQSGRQSIDLICGGFPCQDISVAGKGAGIEGSRSGLWSEYARIIGEVRPRYVIVENVAALLGRGIERVLGDLAALGFDAEWHCIPASAVGAPHRRDRVWVVAYSNEPRPESRLCPGGIAASLASFASACEIADAPSEGWNAPGRGEARSENGAGPFGESARRGWWLTEPDVGRVAHGVPFRVDRLRSLGNAIVPQIAEIIGRAIMASHV